MNSVTFTEPSSETRPTSLRPRSTSMTCSARSFGSAFSSSSIWWSCASVAPRGRVPAIGRRATAPPSTRTRTSGEEPTIVTLPRRRKKRYGDGLIGRSARGARELRERHADAHGRAVVGAVEGRGVPLVYDRVRDDEQAVAQVVEDQERIGEEEDRVREAEIVLGRPRQPLHVVDHVVCEVAHRAALEPREPGHRYRLELPEQVAYGPERVAVGQPLDAGTALEREAPVLRREDHE